MAARCSNCDISRADLSLYLRAPARYNRDSHESPAIILLAYPLLRPDAQ
jgi:hypothetical protein